MDIKLDGKSANILITSDGNKKSNLHIINLLKLIPKLNTKKIFSYKKPNIKSRNLKLNNYYHYYLNSPLNSNNLSSSKNTINNIITLKNNSDRKTNNDNILKKNYQLIIPENNNNLLPNFNNYINNYSKTNGKNKEKKKKYQDNVLNYFRRNFYENDVQISKKAELNQKILNYFIQDKENKEKYRRLKLEKINSNKYRYNSHKNINYIDNKKNDIKKSLILNDFTIYNRIHKVLRFWGKLTNFACPLFQVQKFSLNSEQYKKDKIRFSLENLNNNKNINSTSIEKNNNKKLPKLYTNSSRTINKRYYRKFNNNFLSKNKSDLNITYFNNL